MTAGGNHFPILMAPLSVTVAEKVTSGRSLIHLTALSGKEVKLEKITITETDTYEEGKPYKFRLGKFLIMQDKCTQMQNEHKRIAQND